VSLRSAVALGLLIFCLPPVRSDDHLLDGATADASPLTQTSSDQRIKVTLLYVGPVTDVQIHQPFVVMYMVEDCRTDEELQRHPYKTAQGIDSQYYLAPAIPEVKDGTHHLLSDGGSERARSYKAALFPIFAKTYPNLKLPPADHPDRIGVYEYFYKDLPTGPFDITLHDSIQGYGENNFHFRDIDVGTFSPH